MGSRWRQHLYAVAAYTAVAIVFAWPLPAHLSTHLPGTVDGDTAIYVWNQWAFQHELLDNRGNPYRTKTIFAATGGTDLAQHNYTPLANVLALPFGRTLGVIAAFNVTYLLLGVFTAYALFLLLRDMIPHAPLEGWLAGALFAWSPWMITRGMGHYSLIAAGALPLFVLTLRHLLATRRRRHAVWLGVTVALAGWSDVYYPVYCLLFAAVYVGAQSIVIGPRPASRPRRVDRMLNGGMAALATLIALILWTGGWSVTLGGVAIHVRGVYTPVLVLTVFVLARASRRYTFGFPAIGGDELRLAVSLIACTGVTAAVLLSPILLPLGVRVFDGDVVRPATFWRSSPAGVDLLAFVLPNPNHPLAPATWFQWLARPLADLEHVVSVPLIAFVVGGWAWSKGWRPERAWVAVGLAFVLLSLGPFVHVATHNTYIPGPWAVLRYVPVLEWARTPARFAVMVLLVAAVCFAAALTALRKSYPTAGRGLTVILVAVLLLELLPAPRTLAAATPPAIYQRIALDPRPDVKVLELPFGISDGTSSVGAYTSRTQLYQTAHRKPIVGGGLSRVSRRRIRATLDIPVLEALARLSEDPSARVPTRRLARRARAFAEEINLGYVVIDTTRASPQLVAFAKRVFQLEHLGSDGSFELYRPGNMSQLRRQRKKGTGLHLRATQGTGRPL